MPHTIQNPCLFAIQGTNLLIEQNATVSVYGHQGGAKFMHELSQKMRASLIELLDLQIGVEQALQHVTALACLLSYTLWGINPSKMFVPCHRVFEMKGSRRGRRHPSAVDIHWKTLGKYLREVTHYNGAVESLQAKLWGNIPLNSAPSLAYVLGPRWGCRGPQASCY